MRLLIASSLLLLLCSNVRAFEYEEHKYLANAGLRIALLAQAPACVSKDEVEKAFLSGIEAQSSFGDITGLGDYIHDVDAVFQRNGVITADSGYGAAEREHVPRLKRNFLRFLQASHVNEQHFQLAALLSHLTHHDAAMLTARDRRLERALILEAYGLHFLQDFHAPGHVATIRPLLPDYVAIGVHEKYNAAGMQFSMKNGPGAKAGLQDLVKTVVENFDKLRLREIAQSKIPEKLPLERKDFQALALALGGPARPFLGDGGLAKSKVQTAYLAVLAARSILDVLEAVPCEERKVASANHFQPICWYLGSPEAEERCGGEPVPSDGLLKRAGTPYGEYDAHDENLLGFWFRPGDVLLVSYYNEFAGGGGTDARAGRWELAVETMLASAAPLAFVDAGRNLPRDVARAKRAWFVVPTLLYGASRTFGSNDSTGAHVRLLVAIPWIDVQLSAAYGVRFYDLRNGETTRRYPLTYGLETGFGFLLLHLGTNQEIAARPSGGIETRHYARAGVTVVLPKSVYRIPFRWIGKRLSR